MRKYYLSHIDFSEIVNITTDVSQLRRARARMQRLGLLMANGKPAISYIGHYAERSFTSFFVKLSKRLRNRGGIESVAATLQMLCDRHDYYGFYLYLVILYGFVEWQVPERVVLIPALSPALKTFCESFLKALNKFISSGRVDDELEDEEDELHIVF